MIANVAGHYFVFPFFADKSCRMLPSWTLAFSNKLRCGKNFYYELLKIYCHSQRKHPQGVCRFQPLKNMHSYDMPCQRHILCFLCTLVLYYLWQKFFMQFYSFSCISTEDLTHRSYCMFQCVCCCGGNL